MGTNRYPKALMANIEAAKVGAANHYVIADQILAIAKNDVNMATRHGSHIVARTAQGNIRIVRTMARGFYKVMPLCNGPEFTAPIFEGSKAETIAFMSTLYVLES